MAKKSATTRLELARAAAADITGQIAALQAERNTALIADDDKRAAKLFAEVETLRALAQGYADKIRLLEAEVERERAADVVRRHKVLIDRFQKHSARPTRLQRRPRSTSRPAGQRFPRPSTCANELERRSPSGRHMPERRQRPLKVARWAHPPS